MYFRTLLRNFMGALQAMKINFKADPLKWLYFELNPSWYMKYDGWASFQKEVLGWFVYFKVGGIPVPGHMPTGFLMCMFGLPPWAPFAYAAALEVGQLLKSNAEFFNPLNSVIDILTYGAGGLLYYYIAHSGLLEKLF